MKLLICKTRLSLQLQEIFVYKTLITTAPTNHIQLLLIWVCWAFCLQCLMSGERGVKMNTDCSKERKINSSMTFLLLKYRRSFKYILRTTDWRGVVVSTESILTFSLWLRAISWLQNILHRKRERRKKKNNTENTRWLIIYIRLGKGSTLYARDLVCRGCSWIWSTASFSLKQRKAGCTSPSPPVT